VSRQVTIFQTISFTGKAILSYDSLFRLASKFWERRLQDEQMPGFLRLRMSYPAGFWPKRIF